MHNAYTDLMELGTAHFRKPVWWDQNGVPRFCAFHPKHLPNIYADEAVVEEIACQSCHHKFIVATCDDSSRRALKIYMRGNGKVSSDEARRQAAQQSLLSGRTCWHGDPPNAGCCASGPTMTSDFVRTVQRWKRNHGEWEKLPDPTPEEQLAQLEQYTESINSDVKP